MPSLPACSIRRRLPRRGDGGTETEAEAADGTTVLWEGSFEESQHRMRSPKLAVSGDPGGLERDRPRHPASSKPSNPCNCTPPEASPMPEGRMESARKSVASAPLCQDFQTSLREWHANSRNPRGHCRRSARAELQGREQLTSRQPCRRGYSMSGRFGCRTLGRQQPAKREAPWPAFKRRSRPFDHGWTRGLATV